MKRYPLLFFSHSNSTFHTPRVLLPFFRVVAHRFIFLELQYYCRLINLSFRNLAVSIWKTLKSDTDKNAARIKFDARTAKMGMKTRKYSKLTMADGIVCSGTRIHVSAIGCQVWRNEHNTIACIYVSYMAHSPRCTLHGYDQRRIIRFVCLRVCLQLKRTCQFLIKNGKTLSKKTFRNLFSNRR